jgi:predicted  nucleic acid-binding Zn-ribbon protein
MPLAITEIHGLFNSKDKYSYCPECKAYHLGSRCLCGRVLDIERELDSVYDDRDDTLSQVSELEDEVAALEDTISELRDDITGLQRRLEEERDE